MPTLGHQQAVQHNVKTNPHVALVYHESSIFHRLFFKRLTDLLKLLLGEVVEEIDLLKAKQICISLFAYRHLLEMDVNLTTQRVKQALRARYDAGLPLEHMK